MENTKVEDCRALTILVSTLLREGGHEMNDGNEIPLEDISLCRQRRCASNARWDNKRKRNPTSEIF